MSRPNTIRSLAVLTVGGLLTLSACDGLQFNINFTVPHRASASSDASFDMPEGAKLVVHNSVGSTRVTVDPNATQARVEVTRTALADSQEQADALLDKIVVTITQPTADNNELLIEAPKPAEASDDDSEFTINTDDNGITIVSIKTSVTVAQVELRITLPPAHASDVTQTAGSIRAVGLDTDSALTTRSGAIRAIGCEGKLTISAQSGLVQVEAHHGSLDIAGRSGSVKLEVVDITLSESIIVRLESGSMELALPRGIDADVTAISGNGDIDFRRRNFSDTSNFTQSRNSLEVRLNDGGTKIDLRTESGEIDFDSF